jgi:hypothetical protein
MRRSRILLLAAALALASCGQAEQASTPEPVAVEAPSAEAEARSDLPFCDEVGRRVSEADCADYERLAESATQGMAAFNAPDPMQRGETHMLQLAVSYAPPEPAPEQPSAAEPVAPELNADDAQGRAQSERPAPPAPAPLTPVETVDDLPGQTVEFEPLVGRFMRAELTGVGFEITPRSPASQEVTPDSVTTWSWEVVAEQGGARSLTLTTVVEGCTASGEECVPLRSTTQNYTVNVEVGPMDQALDFITATPDWIKAVTAVLVALAGLIAAWFGVRNALRRGRG